MTLNKQHHDILVVAKTSYVYIAPSQAEPLANTIEHVLTYARRVKDCTQDAKQVIQKNSNVFRPDHIVPSPYTANILSLAPQKEGFYFVVPLTVDNK